MASEQKEKLIRFYKGTEGEETVIKLVDLAENVLRTQKFRISGFLDPFGQEIAETVAANYPNIKVDFEGGYQGAERARAVFVHGDFPGTPGGFELDCVEARWNSQFARLSHRDVLGALMSLGIERDRFGDLLVASDTVKIVCDSKLELADTLKYYMNTVRVLDEDGNNLLLKGFDVNKALELIS